MMKRKSLLILSTIIILTLIVAGIATAVDIEEYIQEKELTEVDKLTLVMIFEDSEDISEETARNLVDSFNEGEMESEEIYTTKKNLQDLKEAGVDVEKLQQDLEESEEEKNTGKIVADAAHQLTEDIQEEDLTTGEQISERAQKLVNIAKDSATSEEFQERINEQKQKKEEGQEKAEEEKEEGQEKAEENAGDKDSENQSDNNNKQ